MFDKQLHSTQMLSQFKIHDRVVFWSTILSLLMALVVVLFWGLNLQRLPGQIPVFYSLSWGQQQLVTRSQFILIPILMVLICLLNIGLSWNLHPSQFLVKRLTAVSALIVCLLLMITALKIVFIFI